jgi:hypothetical protein
MSSSVEYTPLDESRVITPSLRFEEFSEFYHKGYEPFKRNGLTIKWGLAENIQGADACFVVHPETGQNVIFLKHYPTDYADAFLIEHEICHVILKESE